MSLQDPDGAPWRTPRRRRDLLDRKFAYAFAGRGAGVIQWAWNINPYQAIDNEATIGFNRPDGTAKLEMGAVGDFADFFASCGPLAGRLRAGAAWRSSSRTRGCSRGGRAGSTTPRGSCASWPSATASCPRPSPTSG